MKYLNYKDGPSSANFRPLQINGNTTLENLYRLGVSKSMAEKVEHAPNGSCVFWGIPFEIGRVVAIKDKPVSVSLPQVRAEWTVFMHTADIQPIEFTESGFLASKTGEGRLNEHAANYIAVYDDGGEENLSIRYRHQIGAFTRRWGENCFEAVCHLKPRPVRASHEQAYPEWARSQTRVAETDTGEWVCWLWAWRNPFPNRAINQMRFEPVSGRIIIFAISCGSASEQPLRWNQRRKAVMRFSKEKSFSHDLDGRGLLKGLQIDMGQVISVVPKPIYRQDLWSETYNNQVPGISENEKLVEYTAHPDACFYIGAKRKIPVVDLEKDEALDSMRMVKPAVQRVTLKVVEKSTKKLIPVKIHIHGEEGEYLPPMNRHRFVNTAWLEDYSVDYANLNLHGCTYISGETSVNLPLGRVYMEIARGFEFRPLRRVIDVTAGTDEIVIEVEKVLPWREKGWVSADTHVHFLSPGSALLEGSAEGVNIVNLLATQWGEWFTNIGDFDGVSTLGSKDSGADGEYLVRVGTENRQHVLGHISLLGYEGNMITPLTSGGPDESALGDPVENLITEWARQCHEQGGLVVVPHFPDPRAEHAATLVSGDADAVEMTSWGDLYSGINPYSLADYYRYLNCGYLTAAVGGTDKMSAATAVGAVRTYARIAADTEFNYTSWMEAVRRAETFVTYGPLMEFWVDGKPMGTTIQLSPTGGTLDVTWNVASVTVPITRVELIVNGEIRESVAAGPSEGAGQWTINISRSSWLALLVRGHFPDKPEIVAAHSSPVMVDVKGSQFFAAADAVTILEQIEGSIAYLDTVGTKADTNAYRRMRLVLESAHRQLHNRLHQMGYYHDHTVCKEHPEHQ